MKKLQVLFLTFVYVFFSLGFCFLPKAYGQSTSLGSTGTTKAALPATVSLFAKSGDGDYYTLYPEGIQKEEAYIGGFKSVQLDPLEENIYFYDTVLKVIAKINIQSGKVFKVIGKPKSSTDINYLTPVKFSDASLGKLVDFTFDKYGNIFILLNTSTDIGPGDPRILKASFKNGTVKEVLNVNAQFRPTSNALNASNGLNDIRNFGFTLDSLSYDHDKYIYLTGSCKYSPITSQVILKFDPLTSTLEIHGANDQFDLVPKIALKTSPYLSLKGVTFDHNNTCYLSTTDYVNSVSTSETIKVITTSDGKTSNEPFIGDGTGNGSDIGDGGSAKSAYAILTGSRCLCGDKSGDILIADNGTGRVRKILKDSGLITTIVGGGKESLSFGETKAPRIVALSTPNSLLVDKSNNLYITEPNRILVGKNLVVHDDKPKEEVKVANLFITKVAGSEVKDPKGQVTPPDLSLDYTYAGDKPVEVKGQNIPEGTNVKLLSINADGSTLPNPQVGKLAGGFATIPVKIEAGTTKIIKAETDPFIPAPGVYLAGTEPMTAPGELPPEPNPNLTNREEVNIETKDASGKKIGNYLLPSVRFNFTNFVGWRKDDGNSGLINTKTFAAIDPDNLGQDATLIDFGSKPSTLYLTGLYPWGSKATFSIWMRTDSSNVNVPLGIGATCNSPQACEANAYYFSFNQLGGINGIAYTSANVTPTWQKFSVTSNPIINNNLKTIFIGGLNQTTNAKVYVWGARLEAAQ